MKAGRVLLVDGDGAIRQSNQQALELAGLTVTSFAAACAPLPHPSWMR